MAKRKRLNITRVNRSSNSQMQTQAEQQSMPGRSQPPQHESSQESQEPPPSLSTPNPIQYDNDRDTKVRGATRMADIWDLEEGGHIVVKELKRRDLTEIGSGNDQQQLCNDDLYSKVKGPEKKGRVRCVGSISTSSHKSVFNFSQSLQQSEKVKRLETEVKELKDVLGNVLSLLQRQFPQENMDVLATTSRILNIEVPDAGSASNLSPHVKNQSSTCSHQLNENENDAIP